MVTQKEGSALQSGQALEIAMDPEATLPEIRSSLLRQEWKEVGNADPFSTYQPVTVGPVHFCIHWQERFTTFGGGNNSIALENEWNWQNPKTNENWQTVMDKEMQANGTGPYM